ncbi:MAG: hypothetical protein ACM3UP_00410 [Methanocella sp.]
MPKMQETLDALHSEYRVLCSEYERRRSSSATVHKYGAMKAYIGHELELARVALAEGRFTDFTTSTQVVVGKLKELYGMCYGR